MSLVLWLSLCTLPLNLLGNSLVLIVYRKRNSCSKRSIALLVHLAGADLCFGVGQLLVITLTRTLNNYGDFICKLDVFLTYFTSSVSIFILMVMSVERFLLIVKPLKFIKMRKAVASKIAVASAWLSSGVLVSPLIPFVAANNSTNQLYECTLELEYFREGRIYHVILGVIVVVFPYIIICSMYFRTVRHLWKEKRQKDRPNSNLAIIKSRQRLTFLMLSITVLLTLCWIHLPIRRALDLASKSSAYILLDRVSIVVLCVHSMLNPILYSMISPSFRIDVKSLFSWKVKPRTIPEAFVGLTPKVRKKSET